MVRCNFNRNLCWTINNIQYNWIDCRYALNDLWESERDYIRDLKFCMDNYYVSFDGEIPDQLQDKKDFIFSSYPSIFNFHNE